MKTANNAAAYGGSGWLPRKRSLQQELGDIWSACGNNPEWAPLKGCCCTDPGRNFLLPLIPTPCRCWRRGDPEKAGLKYDTLAAAYQKRLYPSSPNTAPQSGFMADLH